MPTFALSTHRAELEQVADLVFLTMLNLQVAPAAVPCETTRSNVTGVVHFAGLWRGAVLFECGRQLACQFTSRLMGVPLPEAIDDDVRDAIGELTNMVAGNLKSVLPPGVGLSMPSVVEGGDYSLRLCGGNLVERVAFTSEAGGFWLTMVEVIDRDKAPW